MQHIISKNDNKIEQYSVAAVSSVFKHTHNGTFVAPQAKYFHIYTPISMLRRFVCAYFT